MVTRASRLRVQRKRTAEGKSSPAKPQEAAVTSPVMQLQRVIGNSAIQRLMTENDVATSIPARTVTKVGKFFKTKGSQQAQDVNAQRTTLLQALHLIHSYLTGTVSHSVRALQTQMSDLMRGYDGVVAAADALILAIGDPSDARTTAALEVKVQAVNEKSQVVEKFLARIKNPPPNATAKQTVSAFIGGGAQRVYMNPNLVSGHVGGAMNKLTKYGSEEHGNEFFKPNQDSIDSYGSFDEGNQAEAPFLEVTNDLMENSGKMVGDSSQVKALSNEEVGNTDFRGFGNRENFTQQFDKHSSKMTNTEFSEYGGIDLNNLKSSNREVAMSRLDAILDANLISKASLALKKVGGGSQTQLGSVAPQSKGKEIVNYNLVDPDGNHPGDQNSVSKADPVLQSKLSALQMIDFLAGQADRHQGNYMVQTDRTGKVIGVTGIDNDMSFGTKDANSLAQRGARQLPALGVYFDKEMAQKIMGLDEDLLRAVLSDLLSPDEIQATVDRLNLLKQHLQVALTGNRLLDPAQWDQTFKSEIVLNRTNRGNNLKRGEYGATIYGA